ncbi:DUF3891 family protein [Paenibacillus sp. OAS669]|uniref:DUF3891 family protein n=1 Tax=Paenibacillus sp. OAS669 TaxID=2663821 RepID=UPI00178BE585|nr:DUF3891 family protein [Paenibacillus sp. OAS669]MBE1443398.1 hypothetical protein [Paenibacillus sp. OAS669]
MIIRETDREFVMITQHDHACLSGHLAAQLCDDLFLEAGCIPDVLLAIQEHDRGWIRLDHTPIWNDRDQVPFSFNDYPMLPKLVLYTLGIDEVEQRNEYAALLCSLHYASFQHIRSSSHPDCIAFCSREADRQERLHRKLKLSQEVVSRHFQLLQLCDDLSLYICLNRPGSPKEQEHPWYRDGFKRSEPLLPKGNPRMIAEWVNEKEIKMTPFLFKKEFQTSIPVKHVSKDMIRSRGLNTAYTQAIAHEQEVSIVS